MLDRSIESLQVTENESEIRRRLRHPGMVQGNLQLELGLPGKYQTAQHVQACPQGHHVQPFPEIIGILFLFFEQSQLYGGVTTEWCQEIARQEEEEEEDRPTLN